MIYKCPNCKNGEGLQFSYCFSKEYWLNPNDNYIIRQESNFCGKELADLGKYDNNVATCMNCNWEGYLKDCRII